MWEKVVLNLVSNAFKFTLEGEIAVRLRPVDGAAELAVRDTGTGIPEAELPRIFERFHRVEGSRGRTHEGTGIGLALVQELVKLHGGSVRAESTCGQGSTFTVTVPMGTAHLPADRIGAARTLGSTAVGAGAFVEEALRWLPDEETSRAFPSTVGNAREAFPPDAPASHPTALPRVDEAVASRRPRILWADDNADMRDYVRRLLGQRYDVEAVPDGEAALAAARRPPAGPGAVRRDDAAPGRLRPAGRACGPTPGPRTIPVILLSARAGEESRVEGLEAGADDYLVKPFSARELLARVGAHLEMNRPAEASRREQPAGETRAARIASTSCWSISDGFIALDRDWRYTTVNDRACESMGMSRDEILGRCIWDALPRYRRDAIRGGTAPRRRRAEAVGLRVLLSGAGPLVREPPLPVGGRPRRSSSPTSPSASGPRRPCGRARPASDMADQRPGGGLGHGPGGALHVRQRVVVPVHRHDARAEPGLRLAGVGPPRRSATGGGDVPGGERSPRGCSGWSTACGGTTGTTAG